MRVLMLGWEFPPHISGGLGTACLGLTRGLAHHDVDVLFVVPKAYGDEPASHVQLVGCNNGRSARPAPREPAFATAPEGRAAVSGSSASTPDTAPAALAEGLSVVEVDSLLRPYLTEPLYEALAEGSEARLETRPEDRPRRRAPTPPPADLGAWGARLDAVVRRARSAPPAAAPREFTGRYGPGLMDEVLRYAEAVAEVVRDEHVDLVHAHDWMTFPAGVAAARLAGVPLVAQVHASEYDRSGDNPNPRVRELEQFGLANADRIVAVSHFTAGVLKRHYAVDESRVRVVHNAVTQAEQRREAFGPRTIPEPVVLFLGRVTFQKGPDYFLEAARRIVEVRSDVKFVVSGSGDMLPGLIENAARLGLARNVHFTGFLRGRDVERMYAMADVYVMPSVSEPFGISPLEAMALDVPTIVSRQSGVSEILHHALKVDFWDVDDLANKILALLTYPALREELVVQGRDEVGRMHWNASGEHLKNVYEELVS